MRSTGPSRSATSPGTSAGQKAAVLITIIAALMWAINEVWRFSAAVVVGLLAVLLVRDHRRDPSALANVFLLAAVAGHLVFPLLLKRAVWTPALHLVLLVSLAVPLAFWLAAHVHFEDDFRVTQPHLWAAAAFLAIGYISWLATVERALPAVLFPPHHDRFWALLPRLLGLVVVLHALMRVYLGAGTDLVLPRLRVRFVVLAVSGSYMLVELLGEVFFSGSASEPIAERAHSLAALVLMLGVAVLSLRVAGGIVRGPQAALDRPASDPALAERLQRLVEVDGVFRQEGLTIGSLADRLGAQEYKVRQLINAQLGFRNFNAFLNRYRVAEAEKLLADPARAHLGVAEIAYQVGYRSVATFNKAFKALNGRTPSEFRALRRG
jgi:AraC-like DNA-binding protein